MKKENFYLYQDKFALSHAIRVASSLDSLVMGEPQILGQFKKSYQASHQAECLGEELSLFFNTVIHTSKKIRHHTPIGRCPVSMAYCSLHTLGIEKFKNARILILGAGETAKKILQHVIQAGAMKIKILNRTPEKAEKLCQNMNKNIKASSHTSGPSLSLSWDKLSEKKIIEALRESDIAISTVQLPNDAQPLITFSMLQENHQPLFLIDLSAPRSISKAVTAFPSVELLDIDEIQLFIEKNMHHRAKASTQAEQFIQEALVSFEKKSLAQKATPKIIHLRKSIEQIIETELQKALQEISQGKPSDLTLKKLAHRLKQKWLHTPSKTLHSAASQGDEELLKLTYNLFDL